MMHEKAMVALTYVWGMGDAVYDVETGNGDFTRYSALQAQALPFSEWYGRDTDYPIGLIRRAYSTWLKNPVPTVSLVKEYATTTYQVG